jgi:propionaldehyde dehydrogenase
VQVSDEQLKSFIYNVLNELNTISGSEVRGGTAGAAYGQFTNIDDAVDAADKAQKQLASLSLEIRARLIKNIRKRVEENIELLSKMACEETGMGRVEDKIQKHLLIVHKTPGIEDIESKAFSGDHGLTLVERAPFGIIGSIVPSTNPSSTVVNNAIGMIAGGNSVVFNPHPSAKKCSCKAVEIINRAVVEAGGPDNLATAIVEPTLDSSRALMHHPKIRLLSVTGGPGIVKISLESGKKAIVAGPGNPPVVVDETADLDNAAKSILDGASFDNNVLCIAEKEVFAVSKIFDSLMEKITRLGAYRLSKSQIDELMKYIVEKPTQNSGEPVINRKLVGKTPKVILGNIGVDVPESTRLVICEVPKDHPLVMIEQLMPVIPFVRVDTVDEAIELAYKAERGCHHTAIMHSKNVSSMTKMAKLLDTTIFVKNAPSYAGVGMDAEGFSTLTIATPTGEGLTSAKTFTRLRRCVLKDDLRIV